MYKLKYQKIIISVLILFVSFMTLISPVKALEIKQLNQSANVINNCHESWIISIKESKCTSYILSDRQEGSNTNDIEQSNSDRQPATFSFEETVYTKESNSFSSIVIGLILIGCIVLSSLLFLTRRRQLTDSKNMIKITERLENIETIVTK